MPLLLCCLQMLVFQFHKGAIRTQFLTDLRLKQKQFQFHKGAIRTSLSIN